MQKNLLPRAASVACALLLPLSASPAAQRREARPPARAAAPGAAASPAAREAPPGGAAAPDADLGKKRALSPDASLAGSIEAKGKGSRESGPALDFETFRYAIEVQVSGKRREEMRDLEQLIKLGGSEQELPGWLFRLAELHWEEAQYLFFEANRRDDAAAAVRGDASATTRLADEKKLLQERSRAEQQEAIARYREIVRRFPSYQRLDEVVFFLGENLWRQNRRREALDAYRTLIKRYPGSRYVPDAWMAYGEYYFESAEKGDRKLALAKALESYRRAAAYTESSIYGYALYKQAWVHYNLGAWSEALDLFRAVIFFGDLPTSTVAPDKKLALAREARKDYVRTYSHVGSPRAASEDFARVGGKDARDMLKSLAQLYFDEGKDHDAILVYHGLIVASPASPDAPLFQQRIVTSAGRMGKKDLAVQQAARFVEMLQAAERRGGDEVARKALAEARGDAENTLRTLAVQYHAEWKKTRDDTTASLAADLYRLHLSVFGEVPQAYELRFFHAELLYALEKFGEAGDEYARVAELDAAKMRAGPGGKPGQPGKYLTDALESAVLAYDVVAKRAEAGEKRAKGDALTKLPVPPEKQRLLAACERYLALAPKGEKRVEIAYKAANIHYRYNDFAPAEKLFAEVAEEHPRHELARYAANLALDGHNLQADWRGMSALARRFWANAELLRAHPELKEDLSKVIEGSAFKVVEELERANRPAEAAEAYVAFVRDWPGSRLAPTALFNASVDLVKAGRLERAMAVREELVRRYPDDALVPRIVLANAQDRAAVSDFEQAAEDSERYFQGWKKVAASASRGKKGGPSGDAGGYEEAKARDALYDASVLREGLAERSKAEADRQLWLDTWPTAPEAPRVALSIADLHARQGSTARETKALEAYQERFARDPADWLAAQGRLARLRAKAGDAAGERRAYEEGLRHWKAHGRPQADRALEVVAQAEYLALEPAFAEYDRIDFAVPGRLSDPRKVKWLRDQVGWKGVKLTRLERAYTAIVQMKQAEPAVCALYKIGLGYDRFAWALRSAPVPAELRRDPALAAEYRNQLGQLAAAPEKKGQEAFAVALAKARELGVENACVASAAKVLSRRGGEASDEALERVPEPTAPPARSPRTAPHGLLARRYVPPAAPERAEGTAEPALPPIASAGGVRPPMVPAARSATGAVDPLAIELARDPAPARPAGSEKALAPARAGGPRAAPTVPSSGEPKPLAETRADLMPHPETDEDLLP